MIQCISGSATYNGEGTVYTDKKENQIFLIYKEIQSDAVAKSYMKKGFLIYEEMRKYFSIYEEAVSHVWLCNCFILNFIIYEEIFFYLCSMSCRYSVCLTCIWSRRRGWWPPAASSTPPACSPKPELRNEISTSSTILCYNRKKWRNEDNSKEDFAPRIYTYAYAQHIECHFFII